MRRSLWFGIGILLSFCFASWGIAQVALPVYAPAIATPGSMRAFIGNPGNYRWEVIGGSIISGQGTNGITFRAGNSSKLNLRASDGNSTTNLQLPVYTEGGNLCDGTRRMPAGTRLFALHQFLRGERLTLTASGDSQVNLYDFQGRFVRGGNPLDLRVPVRGSYYAVISATQNYTLTTLGARCQDLKGDEEPLVGSGAPNAVNASQILSYGTSFSHGSQMAGAEDLVTKDNWVWLTGYDYDSDRSYITKLNQNLAQQWQLQADPHTYYRTLASDSEQNIYAVGNGGEAGPKDVIVLAKYNPQGQVLWQTQVDTGSYDFGYGVAPTPSGGAYLCGFSQLGEQMASFVARYEANGQVWWQWLDSGSDQRIFNCRSDRQGNLYAFADSLSANQSERDLLLIKFTPQGDRIWAKTVGTEGNDLAFYAALDQEENIYLTGMTRGSFRSDRPAPASQDVYLIKINSAGELLWQQQFGAEGGQSAESVAVDSQGNTYTLFYSNLSFPNSNNNSSLPRTSDDMVIAKHDPQGSLVWLQQFNDTQERIFARGIGIIGEQVFVARDHVYALNMPFVTVTVDQLFPKQN
ncbi:MAG: hypothetical protein SFT94_10230 [Pseudanabaenaceae cyanobacterium bins.68]|nr:hypothetical protein [Pseudanabaenaceae cyanobacterium bins.68]